jgi:RimJ/RimL family protein N-acetyltransferase
VDSIDVVRREEELLNTPSRSAEQLRRRRHTGSMVAVSLRQVGPHDVLDIVERRRPTVGWAPDFPTDTDIEVARRVSPTPEANYEPWSSPWLIVCDDVVAGMLGFKGPPARGAIEVGYGVVPSCQRRGIATAALGALLELLSPFELDVRAETAAWNVASQCVLRRNGFVECSRIATLDDGELIEWRRVAQ